MANTVIQLKFSTATATPSSLNVAEPAYSYTSNILYIGSPASTGAIAIGGKFFLDQQSAIFNTVNAAFTAANTAQAGGAAFAFEQANAAFAQANSAIALSAATDATQNTNITNAQNTGDAAFTTANNALPKVGGTITGDLVVTGNLTTSGTRTYANTTNVQLGDNIITLNAEIPSGLAPTENAGFEVNRGSAANVSLVWNEANDNWTATNDGSYFYVLADAAVDATQNTNITTVTNTATAAFLAANSAATLSAATDATQNNSIEAAFSQANTDVTNISISSADFGSATGVASFRVAANGRIVSANTTTIALDASAITSGTLAVARGGTGADTHTTNGVLLGQGTSALTTASSSTEGHVLTINNSGVPTFSHLQGGTF